MPEPRPRGFLPAGASNRLVLAGILGAVAGYVAGAPFLLQPLALYPAPVEALRSLGAPGPIPLAAAAGLGVLLAFPRRTRLAGLSFLVGAAAFCVVAIPLDRMRSDRLEPAVRDFDRQTAPLIAAVHAYAGDHSGPPKRLEDLVPRYLERLPRPSGLGARRIVLNTEDVRRLSRMRMTYPLGDPSGDLGFDLNAHGEVLRTSVWGIHDPVAPQPFDSSAWYRDVRTRAAMADAVRARFPAGTPFAQIARVLGTPESEVELDHPAWWLELTPRFLVYTPATLRPENLGGILVDREGAWKLVLLDEAGGSRPRAGSHTH